jgi:dTDP-4-dehydrorhamnose 3,5-epimerase
MIFSETALPGAFLIDLERREDDRGFFARAFCKEEFSAHGLNGRVEQANVSFNKRRGTLRGMHYQQEPHGETKVVRVVRGRIYDVIVDLRRSSPTHTRWFGIELDSQTERALYIPEGFAHGFLTLEDDTEIFYLMGSPFVPTAAAGARYDDPAFGIQWPEAPTVIAERDLAFAPYRV